jgi:hypothetical protein
MGSMVGEAALQRGRRPEVLRLALRIRKFKLAIVHAGSVRQETGDDKVASVCPVQPGVPTEEFSPTLVCPSVASL